MPATGSPPDMTSQAENRARLSLAIGSTAYSLRPLAPTELPAGASRGYRLTRQDPRLGRVVYVVVGGRSGPSCNCPAAKFRGPARGPCKHLRAARACGLV